MKDVVVVGGGPAGMFCAIVAAKRGRKVLLLEKNEKLGKKLFITGKGRCNVTNGGELEDIFQNIVSNRKFLYSSLYGFTNVQLMEFFENRGCPLKVERGNRVFPVSDKSSDILNVLAKEMKKLGVQVECNQVVTELLIKEEQVVGVRLQNGKEIQANSVVVATGGASYPQTGSTGDGYEFARRTGHTVTPISPALVAMNIKEQDCKSMQGLSLKNIGFRVFLKKKKLYEDFGELLFTHFGISGPVVLSASSHFSLKDEKKDAVVEIDLKPALTREQLDDRILRDFEWFKGRQFKNSLDKLLPAKMIPVIIERSGIDPLKKVNVITKEERSQLVTALKQFTLHVHSFREFKEAIITKGGVMVKEINPSTMESKKVKGLYFIGELLDLDALTGGYNLQIAWSTANTAGENC